MHDSEQVHEEDECVPVGFICYVPFGPPYTTGPGGLGNLRDIEARPEQLFRSARIMPRARSVRVKRVELSHKAKGPVFVLLVTGGTIGGTTPGSVASNKRGHKKKATATTTTDLVAGTIAERASVPSTATTATTATIATTTYHTHGRDDLFHCFHLSS